MSQILSTNRIADHSSGYPSRAMVVDDTRSIREMVVSILTKHGVQAVEAEDGLEAWQRINEQPFDVVITDVEMPCWTGLDLIRAMRQSRHAQIRNTPVIVTSTATMTDIPETARGYGWTYFMAKPVDVTALSVMLRMIVTMRQFQPHRVAMPPTHMRPPSVALPAPQSQPTSH